MSKPKSGGGSTMNKNVKPSIKSGAPVTRKIDPGAVSKLGAHIGNHTQHGTTNPPRQPIVKGTAPQVQLGNANALAAGSGPGAGRQVHRSGSQSQHGPVAGSAAPQGRDILNDFSPGKK